MENDFAVMQNLRDYLSDYNNFECLGISKSYQETLSNILKDSPDIVFLTLDNNPEAFRLVCELRLLVPKLPKFVATATDTSFAYECLKQGFFDYIKKPFTQLDILRTLNRIKKEIPLQEATTLCLKSYNDYRYIDTKDILYLKADNNATDFIMTNGNIISAYKTLKTYESLLPSNFVRIHNSYIINKNLISRIHYGKSKFAMKDSPTPIPFSRSYRGNVDVLKKSLTQIAISTMN